MPPKKRPRGYRMTQATAHFLRPFSGLSLGFLPLREAGIGCRLWVRVAEVASSSLGFASWRLSADIGFNCSLWLKRFKRIATSSLADTPRSLWHKCDYGLALHSGLENEFSDALFRIVQSSRNKVQSRKAVRLVQSSTIHLRPHTSKHQHMWRSHKHIQHIKHQNMWQSH